jgi:hypothetical protein
MAQPPSKAPPPPKASTKSTKEEGSSSSSRNFELERMQQQLKVTQEDLRIAQQQLQLANSRIEAQRDLYEAQLAHKSQVRELQSSSGKAKRNLGAWALETVDMLVSFLVLPVRIPFSFSLLLVSISNFVKKCEVQINLIEELFNIRSAIYNLKLVVLQNWRRQWMKIEYIITIVLQ